MLVSVVVGAIKLCAEELTVERHVSNATIYLECLSFAMDVFLFVGSVGFGIAVLASVAAKS